MENYKVRVNNEAESKEAQELFFDLGASLGNGDKHAVLVPNIMALAVINGLINFVFNDVVFADIEQCKELTFHELRDLVVLKRKEMMNMKEYLNEKYELITAPESEAKEPHARGWLEVPEGSEGYYQYRKGEDNNEFFLKKIGDTYYYANKESRYSWEWYGGELEGHEFVLWQRNAPTVPDEVNKSSKLKSVSETLKERQQQYGCFEDVAHVTQEILKALRSTGGYDRMPPPHKESLHMIASKMARIVNGDFNSIDGWHDIAGYATLVERLIGDQSDV